MPITLSFGHLPKRMLITAGPITIAPLAEFDAAVAAVERSGLVYEGWCYPPKMVRHEGGATVPLPYLAPRFELPRTHSLTHSRSQSQPRLHFLIGVTGFLLGYRLLPEGHGHLQRTPMQASKVIDLHVTSRELAECLVAADETWLRLPVVKRRILVAAINAYQLATAYPRDFEVLTFLYAALDAVWALHEPSIRNLPKRVNHADKPGLLCRHLRIPTPRWARRHANSRRPKSTISEARNALVHDALYAGEPLGYAVQRTEVLLDLHGLASRAIVAGLGIRCRYTGSPVTSQQMHGLDLLWQLI